ncbi:MAG: aminodeoxychorismate synthase component I [Gammaproteobacteria bacterium]|nr:aminodeoxychorismate synthase component I [Gammaproteobacteria bacterium]
MRPTELSVTVVPLPDNRPLVEYFETEAGRGPACLLDSSRQDAGQGRYSFLGLDPYLVLTVKDSAGRIAHRDGHVEEIDGDPFTILRALLTNRTIRPTDLPKDAPPFLGGAIGFLGYELSRHLEELPASTVDDLALPDLAFCFFDTVVAQDHATGATNLIVTLPRGVDPAPVIEATLNRLDSPRSSCATERSTESGFTADFTRAGYIDTVRRVKEYIYAGDIYQANLSQRFHASVDAPWQLYRRLRSLNPAPFSAFLDFADFQVASSSPERFLRVEGRNVETRPIKGTRRRSSDPAVDERLREELGSSAKDRAELSMIVDVERNDLGRVCEYGSVQVAEHAILESYTTVHHLVSTVRGRLRVEFDVVDLLRASFPSGSVTGAPKIRAMEIIDELEPTARGVYTGAIGYLGFHGTHELNVAIRTMIIRDGWAYVQVGGGIVADSDPQAEYQETLDKGEAMFQALLTSGRRS